MLVACTSSEHKERSHIPSSRKVDVLKAFEEEFGGIPTLPSEVW
jgi:hypothetical protein